MYVYYFLVNFLTYILVLKCLSIETNLRQGGKIKHFKKQKVFHSFFFPLLIKLLWVFW